MDTTNTLDIVLWLVTGFIASGMIAFLAKGWIKGHNWQREMKMKRRHGQYS